MIMKYKVPELFKDLGFDPHGFADSVYYASVCNLNITIMTNADTKQLYRYAPDFLIKLIRHKGEK